MSVQALGLRELIGTFERLSRGLSSEQTLPMEGLFAEAFAAVESKVHVVTGQLKASGEVSTGSDGPGNWWAEMTFDRTPGVYELARGGEHFFFDAADSAADRYEQLAMELLEAQARY